MKNTLVFLVLVFYLLGCSTCNNDPEPVVANRVHTILYNQAPTDPNYFGLRKRTTLNYNNEGKVSTATLLNLVSGKEKIYQYSYQENLVSSIAETTVDEIPYIVNYTYNSLGLIERMADSRGTLNIYRYEDNGSEQKVFINNKYSFTKTYSNGNVVKIHSDNKGNAETYRFDDVEHFLSGTPIDFYVPDSGGIIFFPNVVNYKNNKNNIINLQYSDPDFNQTITNKYHYSYDEKGRVEKVNWGSGIFVYTYEIEYL